MLILNKTNLSLRQRNTEKANRIYTLKNYHRLFFNCSKDMQLQKVSVKRSEKENPLKLNTM